MEAARKMARLTQNRVDVHQGHSKHSVHPYWKSTQREQASLSGQGLPRDLPQNRWENVGDLPKLQINHKTLRWLQILRWPREIQIDKSCLEGEVRLQKWKEDIEGGWSFNWCINDKQWESWEQEARGQEGWHPGAILFFYSSWSKSKCWATIQKISRLYWPTINCQVV